MSCDKRDMCDMEVLLKNATKDEDPAFIDTPSSSQEDSLNNTEKSSSNECIMMHDDHIHWMIPEINNTEEQGKIVESPSQDGKRQENTSLGSTECPTSIDAQNENEFGCKQGIPKDVKIDNIKGSESLITSANKDGGDFDFDKNVVENTFDDGITYLITLLTNDACRNISSLESKGNEPEVNSDWAPIQDGSLNEAEYPIWNKTASCHNDVCFGGLTNQNATKSVRQCVSECTFPAVVRSSTVKGDKRSLLTSVVHTDTSQKKLNCSRIKELVLSILNATDSSPNIVTEIEQGPEPRDDYAGNNGHTHSISKTVHDKSSYFKVLETSECPHENVINETSFQISGFLESYAECLVLPHQNFNKKTSSSKVSGTSENCMECLVPPNENFAHRTSSCDISAPSDIRAKCFVLPHENDVDKSSSYSDDCAQDIWKMCLRPPHEKFVNTTLSTNTPEYLISANDVSDSETSCYEFSSSAGMPQEFYNKSSPLTNCMIPPQKDFVNKISFCEVTDCTGSNVTSSLANTASASLDISDLISDRLLVSCHETDETFAENSIHKDDVRLNIIPEYFAKLPSGKSDSAESFAKKSTPKDDPKYFANISSGKKSIPKDDPKYFGATSGGKFDDNQNFTKKSIPKDDTFQIDPKYFSTTFNGKSDDKEMHICSKLAPQHVNTRNKALNQFPETVPFSQSTLSRYKNSKMATNSRFCRTLQSFADDEIGDFSTSETQSSEYSQTVEETTEGSMDRFYTKIETHYNDTEHCFGEAANKLNQSANKSIVSFSTACMLHVKILNEKSASCISEESHTSHTSHSGYTYRRVTTKRNMKTVPEDNTRQTRVKDTSIEESTESFIESQFYKETSITEADRNISTCNANRIEGNLRKKQTLLDTQRNQSINSTIVFSRDVKMKKLTTVDFEDIRINTETEALRSSPNVMNDVPHTQKQANCAEGDRIESNSRVHKEMQNITGVLSTPVDYFNNKHMSRSLLNKETYDGIKDCKTSKLQSFVRAQDNRVMLIDESGDKNISNDLEHLAAHHLKIREGVVMKILRVLGNCWICFYTATLQLQVLLLVFLQLMQGMMSYYSMEMDWEMSTSGMFFRSHSTLYQLYQHYDLLRPYTPILSIHMGFKPVPVLTNVVTAALFLAGLWWSPGLAGALSLMVYTLAMDTIDIVTAVIAIVPHLGGNYALHFVAKSTGITAVQIILWGGGLKYYHLLKAM